MTEQIQRVLIKGKPIGVVKGLISTEIVKRNESEFYSAQRADYDTIWPTHIDMTADEKLEHDTVDGVVLVRDAEYVYPQVQIEYITTDEDGNEIRTPTNYVTYEEFKNETKVVTSAVEEVLDEDGTVLTPAVAEVTAMVRPYVAPVVTDEQIQVELDKLPEYAEYKKRLKTEAMDKLTVVHNSVEYDAHTRSRGDMATITALANHAFIKALASTTPEMQAVYDAVYKQVLPWKGTDNEVHNVQAESVIESLQLGIDEYAKVIGAK